MFPTRAPRDEADSQPRFMNRSLLTINHPEQPLPQTKPTTKGCGHRDMSEAIKFLKSTLRLPASKFPPRPAPADLARYLSRCDDLYLWQRQERPTATTFTLHDGPPYANGELHVGHALNKIVKDIICRTQLAKGRRVDYIPGWDCHGLPIELKALEKHGWARGQDVNPVKLRGAARGFAAKTVQKQMQGFRSWGMMADWDTHWKTMDKDFELRQLRVFKAMVEHGLIFRRNKPVFWSPSSQTALAEAEIERDMHTSTAALVKFPIPAVVAGSHEPVFAVIFTTTPWTLPANQAIAIHKDIKYVVVKSKQHGNLVVGLSRVEYLAEQIGEELEIFQVIPTETLTDSTYSGLAQFGEDAMNRPIFHADFVTADEGTGLVHCAPGHGPDDYNALQPLIRSGRVKVKAPVNDRGEYTNEASPHQPSLLAGQNVFKEGNETVLELLKDEGLLLSSYKFRHKYPIDWRTKEPIIIRATAQWFTDISSIRSDVLKALETVKYVPESGYSRLKSFVENRSEWCISRQRAWGVPIPAIYHEDTDEAVLTPESIDHFMSTVRDRGIDAWWSDATHEPAWIMPGLNAEHYVRGTDTMDVWYDSGSSWALMPGTLDRDGSYHAGPADVYLEGSDQHRGWFQSSLLTYVAYQKAQNPEAPVTAPFQTLVTHGFTLDAQGKKMSKSLGNVISPDEIIKGLAPQPQQTSKKGRQVHPLGPDALRLWAASSDWSTDVTISDKVVSAVHKSLDKYRVTIKLLLGMLADYDPASHTVVETNLVDKMALYQLYQVTENVENAMETFQFHKCVSYINEWIARDLSGFYFEAVKDIIYCDAGSSPRRLAAQMMLYNILKHMQHMLGPITPLLIEESHDFTPEGVKAVAGHPLRRQMWGVAPPEWRDEAIARLLPDVMHVNAAVKAAQERARAEKLLGQSLACSVHIFAKNSDTLAHIEEVNSTEWEQLLVVSEVHCGLAGSDVLAEFARDSSDAHREAVRLAVAKQHVENRPDEWAFCQEVRLENALEGGQVDAYVIVAPPKSHKCDRCWRFAAPQPSEPEQPALCQRCDEVVETIKRDKPTENSTP